MACLHFTPCIDPYHLSIDTCSNVSSCVTVPLAGLAYKQLFQQFNVDKHIQSILYGRLRDAGHD